VFVHEAELPRAYVAANTGAVEAYVAANYEDEHPMGRDLLWSRPDWRASLRRCKEIERRRDATVVFGRDADQFDRFDELL
jgi:hypothetical protein